MSMSLEERTLNLNEITTKKDELIELYQSCVEKLQNREVELFEPFNTNVVSMLLYSSSGMIGEEAKELAITILRAFVLWMEEYKPNGYLTYVPKEEMYPAWVLKQLIDWCEPIQPIDQTLSILELDEHKQKRLTKLEERFKDLMETYEYCNSKIEKMLDKLENVLKDNQKYRQFKKIIDENEKIDNENENKITTDLYYFMKCYLIGSMIGLLISLLIKYVLN